MIDTDAIAPLLNLAGARRAEVAASALAAASRFPLTDEAVRAVAREASRLLDQGVTDAIDETLVASFARISAMSVRRRLRSIAKYAEGPSRDRAFHALAEVGDPSVTGRLLDEIRKIGPAHEELWAQLARAPVEEVGLRREDLPEVSADLTDARFWRAVALARLGEIDPIERFLRGEDELPRLHGNPWDAYAMVAAVRPLPDAARRAILERFGIGDPPDPQAVREAGLLVWALTGIADAEGHLIEPDVEAPSRRSAEAPTGPIAAESLDEALRCAKELVSDPELAPDAVDAELAAARAVVARLEKRKARGVTGRELGSLLVTVMRAANRRAARAEPHATFMTANRMIDLARQLPASAIPVRKLYQTWAAASHPAIDEGQLAWIVSRAPIGDAIVALAGKARNPARLELLSRVGDVVAGRAGSPYRGAGPGGAAPEPPRALIDDEALEAAPPGPPAEPPPPGDDVPPPHVRGPQAVAAPAVLSAEGPRTLNVGDESEIRVRIERPDRARPLAHAATVDIRPEPIAVVVFLATEAVQLVDPVLKMAPAPTLDCATELSFAIVAKRPGPCTAIVHFQQGATTLAMLSLAIDVVQAGAAAEAIAARGSAAAPDPFDDGVVRILIQPPSTSAPYYTYFVTSRLLGLANESFQSPPFAGEGDGATRTRTYASSVYRSIESALLDRASDARVLARRLADIGADMCQQLLPESLIRELWKHRDDIRAIEVTPVEPYIPWELVRLQHPDEGTDPRHLAEYRLVRVLGGKEPARRLGRTDWRYVLGEYPHGLYDDLPAEREFLTSGFAELGVAPAPIPPNPEAIFAAIDPAAFDVLHFACHGEASLDDIDASALIIADRLSRQGTVGVKLIPRDLRRPLTPRRPLVFLSACQSARMGPSLTDFGGWPRVLVDAQAGAMVGTSWAVYEKPAVVFAVAFYRSLLAGETLAEAAGAGRAAAKSKGDASWLAYTVYGWSSARMAERPPGSSR